MSVPLRTLAPLYRRLREVHPHAPPMAIFNYLVTALDLDDCINAWGKP